MNIQNKEIRNTIKYISGNLLDTIYLLQILEDLIDGDGKKETIRLIIYKKIKSAFDNIEKCQKYFSDKT